MVKKLISHFREANIRTIILFVRSPSVGAIKLYEKLGFLCEKVCHDTYPNGDAKLQYLYYFD